MFNVPYLTSCNHCREKKRKCNGKRPTCSLCQAHGVPCEYRRSRRFRKRTQGAENLPVHNIMPVLKPGQQQQGGYQSSAASSTCPTPLANSANIAGMSASVGNSGVANVFALHTSQPQGNPAQLSDTIPTEDNALTRLLSGDMYPLAQQLPQPILQGMNNFMSPFSNPRSQTLPEWVSQQKPGAAMISNLESLANAYQESPLVPMQGVGSPDGTLFGNLTSQIMYGGNIFQQLPVYPHTPFGQPQQPLMHPVGIPSSHSSSSFAITSMITPGSRLSSVSAAGNIDASIVASQSGAQHLAFGDVSSFSYAGRNMNNGSQAQRSSSIMSASQDSNMSRVTSPSGSAQRMHALRHNVRSPSVGALSDASTSGDGVPLAAEAARRGDMQSFGNISAPALSPGFSAQPSRKGFSQPQHRQKLGAAMPSSSMGPPSALNACKSYPEGFVPEIIRIYAREFPADLSPDVLLEVMRGIYSSSRTSLVNIDIELSWYMILKGIIPRIMLFAYISSMARGQVIDPKLMPQLPAKFDEICYEYAIKDIPIAMASPSLWSALSLYLIGRYEFQSSRYDLMLQHYEMAAEILSKTAFHGYAFPWNDAPEQLKRTFEYDYYVYTFWVGFQWHLVSCFNLDRPFNLNIDPSALPQPTSNNGYFAADLPCEFDLLTLLPANSWPRLTESENLSEVWFRGSNDPEYCSWQPTEWKKIVPNYKITVYLQRMLPLGAHMYRLQCEFCEGKRSLANFLQQLQAQQEVLKRWMYSLPKEFEITQEKVNRLTKATANQPTLAEDANLIMDFKELVMTYGLYNTFLIRANRVALLGMLQESLESPATSMHMRMFGLRDYVEAVEQGVDPADFDTDEFGMWKKNLIFHKCRMQCFESIDILCNVVQLSFMLRLNLFSYGTTYVAIAGEVLNVLVGQLGIKDKAAMWKTKTRLGHVLCLLRSLQHWAPAIYMFVSGIQALSDPTLVLEVDEAKLQDIIKRQNLDEQQQQQPNIGGILGASCAPDSSAVGGRSSSGDGSVSQFSNPYPPNHIINLIVDDLDSSLATFLAPAYPMLLLKIIASNV